MTNLKLQVVSKEEFLKAYPKTKADLTGVSNIALRNEDGKLSYSTNKDITVDGKTIEDFFK